MNVADLPVYTLFRNVVMVPRKGKTRFLTFGDSVKAIAPYRRVTCDCSVTLYMSEGDAAMCTYCGQWWNFAGGDRPLPVSDSRAAALARAPMEPYECLAALEGAEQRMIYE